MSLNDQIKKQESVVANQRLEEYGLLTEKFAYEFIRMGYSREEVVYLLSRFLQGCKKADGYV